MKTIHFHANVFIATGQLIYFTLSILYYYIDKFIVYYFTQQGGRGTGYCAFDDDLLRALLAKAAGPIQYILMATQSAY